MVGVASTEYQVNDTASYVAHVDEGHPSPSATQKLSPADERRVLFRTYRLYKPGFVLGLFVMMNFWTYYDRGCMATAIATIRTDHTIAGKHPLSETTAGLVVSSFMAGFLITSPLFTGIGGLLSAKQITIIGLSVWTLAVLATGLVQNFWLLLVSRCLVGVGEAAFAGYTVTMVDNMALPEKRTLWIGLYYSMIPFGTAIGMAVGGVLSSTHAGSMSGWRLCFLTETAPMLVVIAFFTQLPNTYNPVVTTKKKAQLRAAAGHDPDDVLAAEKADHDTAAVSGAEDDFVPLLPAVRRLLCTPTFVLMVGSNAVYTFVLGALSVWAVSLMNLGPMRVEKVTASVTLGGVTAFGGLVGALIGGTVLDKLGGSHGLHGVYKCNLFVTAMFVIAIPTSLIAFSTSSFPLFVVLLVPTVLSLFATVAPMSSALLSAVPKSLRTYAITVSICGMHLFGDVPSPPFAGAVAGAFDHGCSNNNQQHACEASVVGQNCVWSPGSNATNTEPFCTNEFQLRNAMMILAGMMVFAIPMNLGCAWILRNYRGTADEPILLVNGVEPSSRLAAAAVHPNSTASQHEDHLLLTPAGGSAGGCLVEDGCAQRVVSSLEMQEK